MATGKRRVHLHYHAVVNLGRTKTACGKTIWSAERYEQGVLEAPGMTSTLHGALVTCRGCLKKLQRVAIDA